MCPCGGGQSCLVDRRLLGDFVHEDTVFDSVGLERRENCFVEFTKAQCRAMNEALGMMTPRQLADALREQGHKRLETKYVLDHQICEFAYVRKRDLQSL